METIITSMKGKNNLSVIQFYTSDSGTFDYLSLGSAVAGNLIELVEIGERGSVNDIYVVNKSDQYVFMMDGDIIVGAKQNRVINTSILLPPGSKQHIPVSCVEQGRWFKTSQKFRVANFTAPSSIRKMKNVDVMNSLKVTGIHSADQGKVWSKVRENLINLESNSETSDLASIFETNQKSIDEFTKDLQCDENANGLSFFNGSTLSSIEIFNSVRVYKDYFEKLVRSASINILSEEKDLQPVNEAELKYKMLETLDLAADIEKQTFKGVGVGEELRFKKDNLIGLELMFGDKRIHQYIAKLENGENYNSSSKDIIYE